MIANIQAQPIRKLCILAQNDESALQYPLPDEIFGFHAQQSAEKLMKALIAAHGVPYPLTHQMNELLKLVASCGETLPALPFDPLALQPFAVQLRYDEGPVLSDTVRSEMRDSAAMLREFVVARVLELQQVSQTQKP
jgi:hypothetical protein